MKCYTTFTHQGKLVCVRIFRSEKKWSVAWQHQQETLPFSFMSCDFFSAMLNRRPYFFLGGFQDTIVTTSGFYHQSGQSERCFMTHPKLRVLFILWHTSACGEQLCHQMRSLLEDCTGSENATSVGAHQWHSLQNIYSLTPWKCTVFGVNCEAPPGKSTSCFLIDEAGDGEERVVSWLDLERTSISKPIIIPA